MGWTKNTPVLVQFATIVLMSMAASYAFQRTETPYQINGLCFYHYLAYLSTVFLGYVCFSNYKKYIGLAFSLTLSVLALSPVGQKAIELFPSVVPFLAIMMGVTTILVVPNSRGRGFFELLVVLILPAILAESRIGGTFRLLATTQSIGYYELSAVIASIVGGYFYLRYAALTNFSRLELLSNGGSEEDVAEVNKRCNFTIIRFVAAACGIAALLMAVEPFVADALRATVAVSPLTVLALAIGAGVAVMATIFHVFQLFSKENQ